MNAGFCVRQNVEQSEAALESGQQVNGSAEVHESECMNVKP